MQVRTINPDLFSLSIAPPSLTSAQGWRRMYAECMRPSNAFVDRDVFAQILGVAVCGIDISALRGELRRQRCKVFPQVIEDSFVLDTSKFGDIYLLQA